MSFTLTRVRDELGNELLGVCPRQIMRSTLDAWSENDTCRLREVILVGGKVAMESNHKRVLRDGGELIKVSRKKSRLYCLTDGRVLCLIDIGPFRSDVLSHCRDEASCITRLLFKVCYSSNLRIHFLTEAHEAVTMAKFTSVPNWKRLSRTETIRIYENLYWQSTAVVAKRIWHPTVLPFGCALFVLLKIRRGLLMIGRRIIRILGVNSQRDGVRPAGPGDEDH